MSRRKPKSTRRKHTRRRKSRGSGDGLLDVPGLSLDAAAADQPRLGRASTESKAAPVDEKSTKPMIRSVSANVMEPKGAGEDPGNVEDRSVGDGSMGVSSVPTDGDSTTPNADTAERANDGSDQALEMRGPQPAQPAKKKDASNGGHDKGVDCGVVDKPAVALTVAVQLRGGEGGESEHLSTRRQCSPPAADAGALERETVDGPVSGTNSPVAEMPQQKAATAVVVVREEQPSKSPWIGGGGSDHGDGNFPLMRSPETSFPDHQMETQRTEAAAPCPPPDAAAGGARKPPSSPVGITGGVPIVEGALGYTVATTSVAMKASQEAAAGTNEGRVMAMVEPRTDENEKQNVTGERKPGEPRHHSEAPLTLEGADGIDYLPGREGAVRFVTEVPEAAAMATTAAVVSSGDGAENATTRTVVSSATPILGGGSHPGMDGSPLPTQCVFPGDEPSAMNEMIVAVETLTPEIEAWLAGEPSAAKVFDAAFSRASSCDGGSDGRTTPPPPRSAGQSQDERGVVHSPGIAPAESDHNAPNTHKAVANEVTRTVTPNPVRPPIRSPSQEVVPAQLVRVETAQFPPGSGVKPSTASAGAFASSPSGLSMGSTTGFGALGGAASRRAVLFVVLLRRLFGCYVYYACSRFLLVSQITA